MAVTCSGIIKNPQGQPVANLTINITAINTSPTVVDTLAFGVKTGIDGSYSFPLEIGAYSVSIDYRGEDIYIGQIGISDQTVDSTLNAYLMASETASSIEESIAIFERLRNEAQAAKAGAEAAQVKSETAQRKSEQAQSLSETAQAKSEDAAQQSASSASNSASSARKAETAQTGSEIARTDSQNARDASIAAQRKSETAQAKSETAQRASEGARDDSVAAKNASVTAQGKSEQARDAAKASQTAAAGSASAAAQTKTETIAVKDAAVAATNKIKSDAVAAVTTIKNQAASAKDDAEDARDASQVYAQQSESYSNAAAGSAQTAQSGKVDSLAAQKASEAARDLSVAAQGKSETAQAASEKALHDAQISAGQAAGSDNAAQGWAAEARSSKSKAQKWAENPAGTAVEPGKYSALHWAEQARALANQIYASGGLFTPTTGKPYPTTTGITSDTVWIVNFPNAGDSFTYTTGALKGENVVNGFLLFYDTPANTWNLIKTSISGVATVNGKPGPNVTITAADVGALPITGGTVKGTLSVSQAFHVQSGNFFLGGTNLLGSDSQHIRFGDASFGKTLSFNAKDHYVVVNNGKNTQRIYHQGWKPRWGDVEGNEYFTAHDAASIKAAKNLLFDHTVTTVVRPLVASSGKVNLGDSSGMWKESWVNSYRGGSVNVTGGVIASTLTSTGYFRNSKLDGSNQQVLNVSATGTDTPTKATVYLGNPTNVGGITFETKAGGKLQHYIAGEGHYTIYTSKYKPHPSDLGAFTKAEVTAELNKKLDKSGGTLTGNLTVKTSTLTTKITETDTNAPIRMSQGNIGTGAGAHFMPLTQQSCRYSSGYVTHVTTGLVKNGSGSGWGEGVSGFFVATGGSDGSPTEYFTLAYGGKIKHSRGHEFYSTAFKPTWADVGGNSYIKALSATGNWIVGNSTWLHGASATTGFLPSAAGSNSNSKSYLGNSGYWFKESWVNTYRGGEMNLARSITCTDIVNKGTYVGDKSIQIKASLQEGGMHLRGAAGYCEIVPIKKATTTPLWSHGLRFVDGINSWTVGGSRIYHEGYTPSASKLGVIPVDGGTAKNLTVNEHFTAPDNVQLGNTRTNDLDITGTLTINSKSADETFNLYKGWQYPSLHHSYYGNKAERIKWKFLDKDTIQVIGIGRQPAQTPLGGVTIFEFPAAIASRIGAEQYSPCVVSDGGVVAFTAVSDGGRFRTEGSTNNSTWVMVNHVICLDQA